MTAMGQAFELTRNGILGMVFAMTVVSSVPSYAQDGITLQRNYYLDDGSTAPCASLDGRLSVPDSIKGKVENLRASLSRFSIGKIVIDDIDRSQTALCFAPGAFRNATSGQMNNAEYKHRDDLFILSGTDVGEFAHEWKHKHDGVDYDSFEMDPRSAALSLRFSEAGAYAYEVMARHDAGLNGVSVQALPEGGMVAKMEEVYQSSLARGDNQEQAWRKTFDSYFSFNHKHDVTGIIMGAYRQALDYPEITGKTGFASRSVGSGYLKALAVPPGWDQWVFDRTGGGDVLFNPLYVELDVRGMAQYVTLKSDIEMLRAPAPFYAFPSPAN